MATSTETAETLDKKIKSIKEVSESDDQSLKRMLMNAMEQKQYLMESQLSSLKAKYGTQSQSDEVTMVESPPPTKHMKQAPGKYTKEDMVYLKKEKGQRLERILTSRSPPLPPKRTCCWVERKLLLLCQTQRRRRRKRRPGLLLFTL